MTSNYSLHNFIHVRNFARHVNCAERCPLGRTNRLLSFYHILNNWFDTGRIENTVSNCSSIVAWVFIAARRVCWANTYQRPSLLAPVFGISGVKSIVPSLRLLVPSSLQAYRRACDIYYHYCQWQWNVILVSVLRLPILPTSNFRSSGVESCFVLQ
jgi:hypothetical protein